MKCRTSVMLPHWKRLVAQVADANKALLSVSKIVVAGNRVVFDEESYIEDKTTGEWIDLSERDGLYTVNMWVPKDQANPF